MGFDKLSVMVRQRLSPASALTGWVLSSSGWVLVSSRWTCCVKLSVKAVRLQAALGVAALSVAALQGHHGISAAVQGEAQSL